MSNNKQNGGAIWVVILLIMVLFEACSNSNSNKRSDWYYEHQAEIDAYEERHKDDWKGYQGTRRNSWAEDEKLKHDGIDPEKYRTEHGY